MAVGATVAGAMEEETAVAARAAAARAAAVEAGWAVVGSEAASTRCTCRRRGSRRC